MKKNLFILLAIFSLSFYTKAQTILYSNTFSTSLGTATAANSSSGAWVFANACAQSSATGHSAPGHAMFQGSGCQFGNGSSVVSGDLVLPVVPIGALGGTLTFNYFLSNECLSGACTWDILWLAITNMSTNVTTTVLSSNTTPGGLANTQAWTSASVNLSAYAGSSVTIRFQFNSVDGIGNAYDGVYLDDINVIGACSINLFATNGTNSVSPILCSGNSLWLSTNAVSNYSWSTGANTSSILVSPSVTTSYSLTATSISNCVSSSAITVSVSGGIPTLAVTASTNNICLGKTVTLTATGANNYTWTGGVTNGVAFSPNATSSFTVTGTNGCGTSTAATAVTVAPLAVSILATPSVVCSGNSALLTVAAAATSFSWQPINSVVSSNTVFVSPQVSTIFSLTAGDGTCAGTATVLIAANPIPTVNISASSTLVCQGDPVTITASGGISYTWTPSGSNASVVTVNPQNPSLYSVSASNSLGCTAGNVVAIITNPSPTITLNTLNNLICNGDAVTINASGATTYTWSNGANTDSITISPTTSTIIAISGTSNNCTISQTINIDVFTPVITITGSTSICAGKSATLVASGGDVYNWSNGIPNNINIVSPSTNTNYTLTTQTSTSGIVCISTNTIQVTVNPNPTVTVSASRTVMCRAENNTISASGGNSYLWNTFATTASFVITPSLVTTTSYSVIVTGANGCQSTASIIVRVNACTGLEEIASTTNIFNVFPNPNNGEFNVTADNKLQLTIINQLGQLVKTIELNESNRFQIKISGLSSGLYFVNTVNGQKNNAVKIIVQ
jgi:hypothetical protein